MLIKKNIHNSRSTWLLLGLLTILIYTSLIPGALDPTQHIRWIALALFNIYLLIKIKLSFKRQQTFVWTSALLFVFINSFCVSINQSLFLTQYSKLILFVITLVLLTSAIKDELVFRDISIALFTAEAIVLTHFLLSLIIYAHKIFPLTYISINVAHANFMNKNLLSSFLFLMLLYKAVYYSFFKTKHKLLLCLSVANIFAIAMLQTRLIWFLSVLFVPILIYYLFLNNANSISRKRIFISLILALTISVIVIFTTGFHQIISKRINDLIFNEKLPVNLDSSKERIFILTRTVELIKENPFGIGLGNWQIHFPKNGIGGTNWEQGLNNITVAHNDFLSIIAQLGLVGLTILTLWTLYNYRIHFGLFFNKLKDENTNKIISLVGLGYAILSFFDFAFSRVEHLFLLALFSAIFYNGILSKIIVFKPKSFFSQNRFALNEVFAVACFICIVINCMRLTASFKANSLEDYKVENDWISLKKCAEQSHNYFYSVTEIGMPVYWYEGFADYNVGKTESAFINFSKAKELTPFDINVLCNLGIASMALKKDDDALLNFNDALRIAPAFKTALLSRAFYFYSERNYKSMKNDLEKITDESFLKENEALVSIMKTSETSN